MKATVIGSGSFGTAVAQVLATNCESVSLWARDASLVAALNDKHENPTYLPGIPLSPRIKATSSLQEALGASELVVSAAPSHATREVMGKAMPLLPKHVPIVTV